MGTNSKLLNVSLKDILERAWQKHKGVEQYLDKEKFDTDETFLIPLLKHTIKSELFLKKN